MLADYHVHTDFSDDSVFPLEDVCALAVERGFDEICITDHVGLRRAPRLGRIPPRPLLRQDR